MKTKKSIALVSTSALAVGVAQGAVTYSGLLNTQLPCPPDTSVLPAEIDMNGDFITDFKVGYDGFGSSNWRKPFVDSRGIAGAVPLTQPDMGAPVTPFGTMIDATYLAPSTNNMAYLSQNGDGNLVGDWPQVVTTEGYVGVELYDTSNSTTNFGWVHLIYSASPSNPPVLTLVDWGYETTPGLGIPAGSTNTLGVPDIYAAPPSQTVPTGAKAELKVLALGQPAPAYQWRARPVGSGTFTNVVDGGNVSGATTATLTINGAYAANVADYVVVITNTLGAVTSSPPATLSVGPPIVLPGAQTLFGGLTAHFRVPVEGGIAPTYQWRKDNGNLSNGDRISGATTAQLQVSGLTPADAGNYVVVMTIGSITVTSVVSSLTVLPAESESIYEAALLAAGPVAYYRLNETGNPATGSLRAYDNAGALDGTYGSEVTNGFAGIAGPRPADGFPGFASNNAAALFTTNLPGSRIVVAPWNLNTDTLTITAWLNPAADQVGSAGVVYTLNTNHMTGGLNYFYDLNAGSGAHSIGYNWRDEGDFFWDSAIFPPFNQWSFVALVVQPTNATIYIFNTNGSTNAINAGLPPRVPLPFDVPEYIGTDPTTASGSQNFNGAIDEVAIFNKALTQSELQTIYDAALGTSPLVKLEISRSGNNVQLTWPRGLLLEAGTVTGPWTTNSAASSPYITPAAGPQKFYRVLVN